MHARNIETLKNGVVDPQSKAIGDALASHCIDEVDSVRQGKVFYVDLATSDEGEARAVLAVKARAECGRVRSTLRASAVAAPHGRHRP